MSFFFVKRSHLKPESRGYRMRGIDELMELMNSYKPLTSITAETYEEIYIKMRFAN